MTKVKMSKTDRGFSSANFTDRYGVVCSLQKSSLAFEDCIWLGIDVAKPMVLASEAAAVGVITDKEVGWVEYPIPPNVFISTRMHLTQDQVRMLLPALKKFVATGEIE